MNPLLHALIRLAQLQQEAIDRLALQEAVEAAADIQDPYTRLRAVAEHLQIKPPRWWDKPHHANLPSLVVSPAGEWGILRGQNTQGKWVMESWDPKTRTWLETAHDAVSDRRFGHLRLTLPYVASDSPVFHLILQAVLSRKGILLEAALGGGLIAAVALATSFYTMQVYDRVVPTGASQTLLVLTLGVLLAIGFDLVAKRTRTALSERLVDQVDQRLSRSVYIRFLAIRLDQLPQNVGAMAAQLRGYETVRGFLTGLTSHLLVDAPFGLLFILVIALIGGWLALIPGVFFILSIVVGLHYRNRLDALANRANTAVNLKTGLLVETIEGAETIKSGQGGWRMLSRWMETTDEAREYELDIRKIMENTQHTTAVFQQLSYVLLIASGALLVSRGELTLGGLIACSIISGRVLNPVAMIPRQLVQWAHTKAALQGLDHIWKLQDDHHGHEPIAPENIQGRYRLESVTLNYGEEIALSVRELSIRAGEKVGILGPIGAGKTSLLRLLSGMYKPGTGRVLLDDVDLAHLSKPLLAEHVGYLQQEGRLFAGTLRDNLILGMIDPGDDAILQIARQTGLMETVIAAHPKGLQQPIYEGGSGLSGGQRRLVNLTGIFQRKPTIWLLDEPTASMDRNLEIRIIGALKSAIGPQDTLVLVTHKPEMLTLVDRLIVIAKQRVAIDGPKQTVLTKLQVKPSTNQS